jgi:hypothetical protein
MIVVQGGRVYTEPEPEDRFELMMEHPFARQRYPGTVQVILDVGSFVIKLDTASAAFRALRGSLLRAADLLPEDDGDPDDGAVLAAGAMAGLRDAHGNACTAGLANASGEFGGSLTDGGLDSLAAMLGTPPVPAPGNVAGAMDRAAKQAVEDARLGLRIASGSTFQVAASAITTT